MNTSIPGLVMVAAILAGCGGSTTGADNAPGGGGGGSGGASGTGGAAGSGATSGTGGAAGIGGTAGTGSAGGGGAGGATPVGAVGCDEFKAGPSAVANLNLGVKAQPFVEAAADLQTLATRMATDVKAACADISTKLGATDTWSALQGNNAIAGACDAASAAIKAFVQANAIAPIAMAVSGGQCSIDAAAQTSCENGCKADPMCAEPAIEVRCPPGQLAGQCGGLCQSGSTCEGTVAVLAMCQGTCSGMCTGTCSGTCQGTVTGGCVGTCEGRCNGVATPAGGMASCAGTCEGRCSALAASAMCSGACSASCKGTCSGNCTLDANANINCGAGVNCRGGCSIAFTVPRCEGELQPPACAGDASCQASCSGRAVLDAVCTPPTVTVLVTGTAPAALALKAVLEADFPALLFVAKIQGQLALRGAAKVTQTASAAVSGAASLGGKAIACVGTATSAAVSSSATVSGSASASASVVQSVGAF